MREVGRTGEFVDPAGDADTIMTELILADMGTLEKQLPKLEKEAKRDKELMPKFEVAKRLLAWLNEGKRAASMEMTDEERAAAKGLFLLTMKPILYVANVDEDMLNDDLAPIDGVKPLPICAKIEAELSELDPEDAADYLESLGLEQPGLDVLAQAAYKLLGLQSFFTAGEMEVKAWTVRQGATAPQAPASSTPILKGASSSRHRLLRRLRGRRRLHGQDQGGRQAPSGGTRLHHAGRRHRRVQVQCEQVGGCTPEKRRKSQRFRSPDTCGFRRFSITGEWPFLPRIWPFVARIECQ